MLPDLRVRQRDYLLEISRALTEELDQEKVLARIVKVATELLASSAGLIALRDPEGGWRIASLHGISEEFTKYLDPLLADIPHHEDPAKFALPEVNRRLRQIAQAASMGLLTGVGLPMIAREQVVGVIFIFRSYRGRFSRDDRRLLAAFASQAAIAVTNARLYTQVTDQKRYLDAVLDSSADGIFILDPQYRVLRFNRACTRLTGYDSEETVGQGHDEVIRWESREPGMTLRQAEAGGWPLTARATLYTEGDLIRKNMETISVGITYAPTFGSEGKLLSIVANIRDITKFREAEELKSTFISVISHELRTPVALIKGYVGTLRREDAEWDQDEVRNSLKVIEEESDRLATLIDDLLEVSRLQSDALALDDEEVDLSRLIQTLVERFRTQSPEHTFELELASEIPIIQGDEQRISQVISNLLSNAVKYSRSIVQIHARVRQQEVMICVQDDGPGIAPEDRARIFDRFYRSPEIADSTQGAGLGLFLAKAVVDAHGGEIWVDDRIEQGARLCFSLPLSDEPEN
jgi:PAS domain S-box-containing protein